MRHLLEFTDSYRESLFTDDNSVKGFEHFTAKLLIGRSLKTCVAIGQFTSRLEAGFSKYRLVNLSS